MTTTNDDVDSRRAAVKSLATSWGKSASPSSIVEKAAAIAEALGGNGVGHNKLDIEIQNAVQKHASAFLASESPLEVAICAGMAAVRLMQSEPGHNGWMSVDVYSNALWLALSFQPILEDEKRENLRREVLDRAQERSNESAEKARTRDEVALPSDFIVSTDDAGQITTNFKSTALSTILALRRNAALDREELDFLWWCQLTRSKLLNRPFTSIPQTTRLVASGIECSKHLRRLPAEVHRDLVLRTLDDEVQLDLTEVLAEIGDDRAALAEGILASNVTSYATIFPLLNAIVTGSAECWGAQEKRTAATWGGRALLEAALSRMMTTGLTFV